MKQTLLRCIVGALAMSLGISGWAQVRPLNDTGQVICYNNTVSTGTVTPGTPDPETAGFDEQDCTGGRAAAEGTAMLDKLGAASVSGRDYSKIANNGSDLPTGAALGTAAGDWGCTRDNVTGLTWEVKIDDNGLRDKDHGYTWYNTNTAVNGGNSGSIGTNTCNGTLPLNQCNTTAYVTAVNALVGAARLCAATDWRLPNRAELASLTNYSGAAAIPIDGVYFPNTPPSIYWGGVNFAPDASRAWDFNFNDASTNANLKSTVSKVRLVRGGS